MSQSFLSGSVDKDVNQLSGGGCHGHPCPRHVAYDRMADVPVLLVEDLSYIF